MPAKHWPAVRVAPAVVTLTAIVDRTAVLRIQNMHRLSLPAVSSPPLPPAEYGSSVQEMAPVSAGEMAPEACTWSAREARAEVPADTVPGGWMSAALESSWVVSAVRCATGIV